MQPLSPVEAIAPAWNRTRALLFEPFALRRFLKLTLVGFVAALGSGGFNFNSPMRTMHHPMPTPGAAAAMAVFGVISFFFALAALAVSLVLFYVGSRMQFVLFEMVATKATVIAPMWQRYRSRVWRWIGLKLLFFLAACVAVLIAAIPLIVRCFRLFRNNGFGGMKPLAIFLHFLGPVLLIVVVVFCLFLLYELLWAFVLPVMAMEDAGLTQSVRKSAGILLPEPATLLSYICMRFLLGIAIGVGGMIVWGIATLIVAIPLGLVGALLFFGLHHAGMAGWIVMGCGFAVEGVIAVAWLLCSYIGFAGTLMIFMQAYAQFFYGGRYQPLGDLLEPPPPVYIAPPVDEPPPTFEPPIPEPA